MKERETEKLALGEEEATRPETRSLEECGVDRCEWNTGDGRCNYYGLTGIYHQALKSAGHER